MTEIILQTWSDLNMAGYEWRREVYATSNGTHWSIKARQIDENTGQAYRVRGVYRLKSARGVVAGLDRVFRNDDGSDGLCIRCTCTIHHRSSDIRAALRRTVELVRRDPLTKLGAFMSKFRSIVAKLIPMSVLLLATPAHAVDMVGTWVGVASVAVIGPNPHHDTTEVDEVRFANTEFTFIIDKQQGRNFSGYRFSKNGFKDNFVGAFRANMKSGVIADSDGTRTFDMVGDDLIDSCYTHTVAANGKSTVAECNELRRQ